MGGFILPKFQLSCIISSIPFSCHVFKLFHFKMWSMDYDQTKHLVNEIAKSVGSEIETIWWPDCFPQILELMWLLSKHLQS